MEGDKPGPELGASVNAAWVEKYILWQQSVNSTLAVKEAQGAGADQSNLQLLLQDLQEMVGGVLFVKGGARHSKLQLRISWV